MGTTHVTICYSQPYVRVLAPGGNLVCSSKPPSNSQASSSNPRRSHLQYITSTGHDSAGRWATVHSPTSLLGDLYFSETLMKLPPVTSLLFLAPFATAQLSGSVGPTTSLSSKSTLCNVLDYGGSVGSSDIGPAIQKAFDVRIIVYLGWYCTMLLQISALRENQQRAVNTLCSCWCAFPCMQRFSKRFELTNGLQATMKWRPGSHSKMEANGLSGSTAPLPALVSRCLAPRITSEHQRTCIDEATTGGNMIAIQSADDFEFYSQNSAGGIQGNGYECRNAGYVDSACMHEHGTKLRPQGLA